MISHERREIAAVGANNWARTTQIIVPKPRHYSHHEGAGNYLRGPGGRPLARSIVAMIAAVRFATPRCFSHSLTC